MADEKNILKTVQALSKPVTGTELAIKQFEPSTHEVFDAVLRPKKQIVKPTGAKDASGNDITATKIEDVVRIGLPLQKLIVKRRVAFMNVGKTTLKASPKTEGEKKLLGMVTKCREDNKLAYKNKDVATRMMSELQCAKLWFSEPVEKGYWGEDAPNGIAKMRMKVLSPLLGDKLMPVFDNNGDLQYFGRGYKTRDEADTGKEIDNIDIYTKEGVWQFQINGTNSSEGKFTAYSYGKIPIIYYSQAQPEWSDVQPAIARLETAISNLGDTNDYNGSPILAITGKIKGFATKGERGKTLELENGAEIKYVNWDSAPESIKIEIDMLISFIYTCTQTPNITFEEMKGLDLSGVAMDRVFMDAHLAAQDKLDGIYGECEQREINFLKSACAAINTTLKPAVNLEITPEFPLFKINDESERADLWLKASGNKPLVSQKTAIERAGFTVDADEEIIQIGKETPLEKPIIGK